MGNSVDEFAQEKQSMQGASPEILARAIALAQKPEERLTGANEESNIAHSIRALFLKNVARRDSGFPVGLQELSETSVVGILRSIGAITEKTAQETKNLLMEFA